MNTTINIYKVHRILRKCIRLVLHFNQVGQSLLLVETYGSKSMVSSTVVTDLSTHMHSSIILLRVRYLFTYALCGLQLTGIFAALNYNL